MPALVAGIHVLGLNRKVVVAGTSPGHDEAEVSLSIVTTIRRDHVSLMPANLITLPHLSISPAISLR